MANLQTIFGTDTGTVAMQKMDYNIKAINLSFNIKNNLTETIPGFPLDAVQGAILAARAAILELDRGYLTIKVTLSGASANTLVANGKYRLAYGVDIPIAAEGTTYLIDVIAMSSVYVYQHAFCVYSPAGNTGKCHERFCNNGTWSSWEEVARITRTSLALLNSWNAWGGIYTLKIVRVGTIATITGTMENGIITTGTGVFIAPAGFRPVRQECVPIYSSDNKIMNLLFQQGGTAVIDNSYGVTWTAARKLVNFSYECS